ncbi:MAG: DUF4232 domain-containing protein [Actinomycetes bacterium]
MRLLTVLVLALAATATATGAGASPATPCLGTQLGGAFKVVPGSAGAGSIVYSLRVQNISMTTCFVTGIPGLTLLRPNGRALPTHAGVSHPGMLAAILVTLAPGKAAALTARFSPDVPGVGDHTPGACEPVAYRLRVSPSGGGSAVVPITPPTSVCERGSMTLTAFIGAR